MSISRQLRIIAIPLTRPNLRRILPHPKGKLTRQVYFQFQTALDPSTSRPLGVASGYQDSDPTNSKKTALRVELDAAKWVTNKAAHIWAGFAKGKSGWKRKVGGWMLDRLDFEKLALIDLSLSPHVAEFESPVSESRKESLSISYPPSLLSPSDVLSELRVFVEHRMFKHRMGFYLWMLSAPLSIFFIDWINVWIPKLPFFYCIWRVFTHDRAYKSSKYLQSLLEEDLIVPEPSETLNEVYNWYSPTTSCPFSNLVSVSESELESSVSSSPSILKKTNPEPESQTTLLLAPEAVSAIINLFELKSTTASAALHRAIELARIRVANGRDDR